MCAGNIGGDIHPMVLCHHVPELHSRSSCDGIAQEGSGTSHDPCTFDILKFGYVRYIGGRARG